MHTSVKLAASVALLAMACSSDPGVAPGESSNELGLELTRFDDNHIAGRLTTALGAVDFVADQSRDGLFDIQFDRGRGWFGSQVDLQSLTVDFLSPTAYAITTDDRFIMTALATGVEEQLGKESKIADNLFRQSSLWAAHPTGGVILTRIVADPNRGWTSLCSAGACCTGTPPSRSFTHSGTGCQNGFTCGTSCNHKSTALSHTVQFGKCETANPCNARCGASCASVGTSAYTVDCGEHDVCERRHTGDCGGEFTDASDDFSFAGNCSC